jgi:adenylosuccinate lyase
VATSLLDSTVYGGLWAGSALAPLFEEAERTRDWLEILAVLAEVQGEFGLIPTGAARGIAATCRGIAVDASFLEELRRGREASGHSTAGLLRAVASRCPAEAGEWVHFGATVQDLSDTSLMRTLAAARRFFSSELAVTEEALSALAARHRDTPMLGRTHGQQGLPITFGFKAAGWVAEVRRHRARLDELRPRLEVGQLAGGVGSLSALGPRGLEVQAAFCARLGLQAPAFSWTASRDVLAEWGHLLTLICGTGDRIGHEVYNLQRGELGELSEAAAPGVVGSLTMPQKRNPELGEHLGTLARVVRHLAACLNEGLVHDHERDGRSWKAEWFVVPELTLLAGRAAELLSALARGLEVHPERMRRNLEETGGLVLSEALMLAVAARSGRETAHRLVFEVARVARDRGWTLEQAALANRELCAQLSPDELRQVLDYRRHTGLCAALVDRLLGQGEGR